MTHVLMVLGSARKGRVADSVAKYVTDEAKNFTDLSLSVVDLAELDLPFFDNEHAPSSPDYTPTDARVIEWGKLVREADAVLFVTPEYNHTLSAIQKNAIDSLYAEWENKPVALVAYGWAGGSRSIAAVRELAPVVKMDLKQSPAELYFTKDIDTDGSLIDSEEVAQKIHATLKAL